MPREALLPLITAPGDETEVTHQRTEQDTSDRYSLSENPPSGILDGVNSKVVNKKSVKLVALRRKPTAFHAPETKTPVGEHERGATSSTLSSTTAVARLSKKKKHRDHVPMQRVAPVTVLTNTFPTLADDTLSWLRAS